MFHWLLCMRVRHVQLNSHVESVLDGLRMSPGLTGLPSGGARCGNSLRGWLRSVEGVWLRDSSLAAHSDKMDPKVLKCPYGNLGCRRISRRSECSVYLLRPWIVTGFVGGLGRWGMGGLWQTTTVLCGQREIFDVKCCKKGS